MADTKLSALSSATLTDADELYINDGGNSRKATVAELRTALGGIGFLSLSLFSAREIASNDIPNEAAEGGRLTLDSAPNLKRLNAATDKAMMIEWPTGNLIEIQFEPTPIPPDLDPAVDASVSLLVRMSGSADTTTTIDIQVWDGIGDTEMGTPTGNLTSTLAEHKIAIANANISGHPTGVFNVNLVPAGAHATDTIQLLGAWIEYTKKLP